MCYLIMESRQALLISYHDYRMRPYYGVEAGPPYFVPGSPHVYNPSSRGRPSSSSTRITTCFCRRLVLGTQLYGFWQGPVFPNATVSRACLCERRPSGPAMRGGCEEWKVQDGQQPPLAHFTRADGSVGSQYDAQCGWRIAVGGFLRLRNEMGAS